MKDSELHVQASLWNGRSTRTAVLLMEGAARDRANGGGLAVDALHRIVLSRGLRLTTDLDRRDCRPVRGWRARVDRVHAMTLEWPHRHPLLDRVPVDLPPAWLRTAFGSGEMLLVVGYGIGLREPAREPALLARLERAARDGALACGVLPLVTVDPDEVPIQRANTDDRIHVRLEPIPVG